MKVPRGVGAWQVLVGMCLLSGGGLAEGKEALGQAADGVVVTVPVLAAAPLGVAACGGDILEQAELFLLQELRELFPDAKVSAQGVGSRQAAEEQTLARVMRARPGSRAARLLIEGQLWTMLGRELGAATSSIDVALERWAERGAAQAKKPRATVHDSHHLLRVIEVSLVFPPTAEPVVRGSSKPASHRRAVASALPIVIEKAQERSAQLAQQRRPSAVWNKPGTIKAPWPRRVCVQAGRPEAGSRPR